MRSTPSRPRWRATASTRSSRSAVKTPWASRTKLGADGVHAIGVPKTIDNDLSATDVTFGFDTAVQIAVGRDRPAAHHGREPRPGDGGRGDGPARGLDRPVVGHRRRRRHRPRARAAVRHRRRVRPAPAPPRRRRELLDRGGVGRGHAGRGHDRPPGAEARRVRPRPPRRHRQPASRRRSSRAPGSRRASPCSATCCAAGRPRRSTGCSRPASGSRRPPRSHDGDFGTMVALQGNDIVRVPIADAVRELKTVPDGDARHDAGAPGLRRERAGSVARDDAVVARRAPRAPRPRGARGEPLPRPEPGDSAPARVRRPGGGAGAGRRGPHGRARPPGALAALVLPASGRPHHPDRLRGRPHPRRPELHHPPGGRDPARQGHLQPVGVVPGRRARPRPPDADAGGARSRDGAHGA